MPLLLDTATVAPEERAGLWSEWFPRCFFPAQLQLREPTAFRGRVAGHRLGPLELFVVQADANASRRSAASIARADPETLNVGLQLRGRSIAEQGGRTAVLEAGDLSSWDTSHPLTIRSDEPHAMLLVFVPRALLGPGADRLYARTALRTAGTEGIGAIVAPFLRQLWRQLDAPTGQVGGEDLADSVLGLVRGLHAAGAGERAAPAAPGPALLARMKAHIDQHLAEADLGPDAVARAHFVSTRYAHKLFAGEPVGLSAWITQRRLERIRRDLLDPELAGETVSAIGRRWGLANPSHLSRLFRERYGVSPRDARARAWERRAG